MTHSVVLHGSVMVGSVTAVTLFGTYTIPILIVVQVSYFS